MKNRGERAFPNLFQKSPPHGHLLAGGPPVLDKRRGEDPIQVTRGALPGNRSHLLVGPTRKLRRNKRGEELLGIKPNSPRKSRSS